MLTAVIGVTSRGPFIGGVEGGVSVAVLNSVDSVSSVMAGLAVSIGAAFSSRGLFIVGVNGGDPFVVLNSGDSVSVISSISLMLFIVRQIDC